jgi:hypothetical protein
MPLEKPHDVPPSRNLATVVTVTGRIGVGLAELGVGWDWLETTVSDVTDAQANWWPPGTANSIGATYLHVVINPDVERPVDMSRAGLGIWTGSASSDALTRRRGVTTAIV